MTREEQNIASIKELGKSPTGIKGFDEITGGGLPTGRASLICGGAGAGKTVFGMEFLLHGALQYNEPGVYMPFEENAEELTQNFFLSATTSMSSAPLTRWRSITFSLTGA